MSLIRFALAPSPTAVDHARALAELLTDLLATPVDVTVSQSSEHLARNVLSRAVDAAYAPADVCARIELHSGCVAACAARDDVTLSASALLKRRGASTALNTPKAIRAAWSTPDDVGGHLLPVAHLRETRKLDPARHFAAQQFCGSTTDAVAAVLDGRADLCAVPAHQRDEEALRMVLERHAPERSGELQVLELTARVAAAGVVAMDQELAGALQDALVHLEEERAGERLLTLLFDCDRFVRPPPQAYRALHAMVPREA